VSDSKAARLLAVAARQKNRLERHLIVAAALDAAFPSDVIVVGGTAEEFWTSDAYHETDLDVCAPIGSDEMAVLRSLGFVKEGRHWYHAAARVAVEFPDTTIDGDLSRTVLKQVARGAAARIIGVDDLYLDRLRHATMNERAEDVHFHSALAVAAACFDIIDWKYVRSRLLLIHRSERTVGPSMRRINTVIRRRAAKAARQ
jgi:hypothetical protein